MINAVALNNFGPLAELAWENLGPINLVIGGNGCGKTFLLKALYCAMRTIEDYKRGDNPNSASEILAQKLYWTFQPEKIGDLVMKGAAAPLSFSMEFDGRVFRYSFGKDTAKQIISVENHVSPRENNSVFLPSKEVLSLYHIILESRERDQMFGFDDTYLDLVRALRPPTRERNYREFADSRKNLDDILGGRVEYDEQSNRWYYKSGNQTFPIGVTAEGVKKIAILDTLLGNRYLDTDSVVFIDEPEAALHPSAISKTLETVAMLAERGIQFFLASHSYFVVKKLYLIALKRELSIPMLTHSQGNWVCADLKNDLPENPIIDESIGLYKEKMEMALQ